MKIVKSIVRTGTNRSRLNVANTARPLIVIGAEGNTCSHLIGCVIQVTGQRFMATIFEKNSPIRYDADLSSYAAALIVEPFNGTITIEEQLTL